MRSIFIYLIFTLATLPIKAQVVVPAFDHKAILVTNLETSAAFYREILQLDEIVNKTGLDHIRWFALGNNTELHLIESASFKRPPEKGIHLALRTSTLDEFMEFLRSRNVLFENWDGEPGTTNTRADGVRQIYLQDPDGYWLEINENE